MALSEGSWDSQSASKAVAKRYSTGSAHSRQIKNALQGKRLAGKHVRPAIDRLAKALNSDSDAVAVMAANSLLDRALGKAASAPEDIAAALAVAAAPADFLLQLLQMRSAAQQLRAIEQQPIAEATLVDDTKPTP